MNHLQASLNVIGEMLAINNQRQAVEIILLKEENQDLKNQVRYLEAALRSSEESHERLTREVIAEAVN